MNLYKVTCCTSRGTSEKEVYVVSANPSTAAIEALDLMEKYDMIHTGYVSIVELLASEEQDISPSLLFVAREGL